MAALAAPVVHGPEIEMPATMLRVARGAREGMCGSRSGIQLGLADQGLPLAGPFLDQGNPLWLDAVGAATVLAQIVARHAAGAVVFLGRRIEGGPEPARGPFLENGVAVPARKGEASMLRADISRRDELLPLRRRHEKEQSAECNCAHPTSGHASLSPQAEDRLTLRNGLGTGPIGHGPGRAESSPGFEPGAGPLVPSPDGRALGDGDAPAARVRPPIAWAAARGPTAHPMLRRPLVGRLVVIVLLKALAQRLPPAKAYTKTP